MAEVHKGRPRIWKDPSGNPPTLPPGVDSYDKCTVHSPSGQHFVGLFRQGVIDPVKVVSSNPRSDQYTPEQLYRNHYESARRQRIKKFVNLLRKASLAAGKGEVLPKTKGKEMPRSKLTLNEDSDNSSVSSTEIFGSSRRTSTQTMYSRLAALESNPLMHRTKGPIHNIIYPFNTSRCRKMLMDALIRAWTSPSSRLQPIHIM